MELPLHEAVQRYKSRAYAAFGLLAAAGELECVWFDHKDKFIFGFTRCPAVEVPLPLRPLKAIGWPPIHDVEQARNALRFQGNAHGGA